MIEEEMNDLAPHYEVLDVENVSIILPCRLLAILPDKSNNTTNRPKFVFDLLREFSNIFSKLHGKFWCEGEEEDRRTAQLSFMDGKTLIGPAVLPSQLCNLSHFTLPGIFYYIAGREEIGLRSL